MDQRKDEITRRPLYGKISSHRCCKPKSDNISSVYHVPQDILTTLTPRDDPEDGPRDETVAPAKAPLSEARTDSSATSKSCSLCGLTFHTVEDQRSHTRSDLHAYNLKQKMRGAPPVTEGDFEMLVRGTNALGTSESWLTAARSGRESVWLGLLRHGRRGGGAKGYHLDRTAEEAGCYAIQ